MRNLTAFRGSAAAVTSISDVLRGSFTAQAKDEALVVFSACEDKNVTWAWSVFYVFVVDLAHGGAHAIARMFSHHELCPSLVVKVRRAHVAAASSTSARRAEATKATRPESFDSSLDSHGRSSLQRRDGVTPMGIEPMFPT